MSRILLAMENEELRGNFARCIDISNPLKSLDCDLETIQVENTINVISTSQEYNDISLIVMDYDLPCGDAARTIDPITVLITTSMNEASPMVLILGPLPKADRQLVEGQANAAWIDTTEFFDVLPGNDTEYGIQKIEDLLSIYIQKNGPLETDNPKQGKQGLIDLTIDRSNTMKCDTWLVKDNRPDALDTGEPFHYDAGLLKDMTRDTKTLLDEIEKDQTFSRHYRSIGEKARQILTSDRRTTRAIDRLFLEVGGAENVWVRFQMASSSITETPFEAILRCDREDEDDPYQLELSPVYRVINKASGIGEIRRKPIFSKRFNHHDKLSCLVINASASGEVQPFGDIEFPPLCQMLSGDGETETVRAIFEDLQDSGPVLVVEKIEFDSDEKLENPSKYLEDKLQEREWDIVHFCGHSFFDNELGNDPGYIFLPGDILAKPVSISRFSDWCRKTDLIFMSSCQSAAPGFIHALADKGIPMIVGYRWRVTDAGASFFAEYFYRKLFDEQRLGTIETAFSMTQRRMKDPDVDDLPGNFQDNRIWASSMLVLQNV